MREIKFRAWVNNSKKFEAIEFIGAGQRTFPVYTKGNKYWFPMQGILEQYTGLKDKNGIEIYEGDIVAEITQFDDDEPDIYEVIYNETGDYPAFDFKGWTGEVNGISELSLTCGIEVIGNIHENADLLEEQ